MDTGKRNRGVQALVATVAILFGLATILAGGRVLAGSDPGYLVLRPLLIFNTSMGVAYVAAGVTAWYRIAWGRKAAAGIFLLNLLVLGVIALYYRRGGGVAVDSLRAMSLRTAVWCVLFLATAWLVRSRAPTDPIVS